MTDDLVKWLFDRLGSISTSRMEGDNLAILLCGVFENPDQEIDDEYGWTPDAVLGCDEVLDAIKAHFQPFADRIEALTAENERLREAFGGLIEQCHAVEKELTEEYYGTHYSGESLPLCIARAALSKETAETFTRSDNV